MADLTHWGTREEQEKKLKLMQIYYQKFVCFLDDEGLPKLGYVTMTSSESNYAIIAPIKLIEGPNKVARLEIMGSKKVALLDIEENVTLSDDQELLLIDPRNVVEL